jgi:uncharacterized membrane protein YagU involved in acid resistance
MGSSQTCASAGPAAVGSADDESKGVSRAMNNPEQAGQPSSRSIRARSIVPENPNYERPRPVPAIFWAGLTCGWLDLTAALLTWGLQGVSPVRLLQAIASGLLGLQSFRGGWPTALLGVLCHFFIAYSVATLFYLASRKLKFMTRHAIFSGLAYGVAVYLVMYWIVIPLSRLQPAPLSLARNATAIVTHIVCVGLPISLVVRRYSAQSPEPL